jgi:hypothetical protein
MADVSLIFNIIAKDKTSATFDKIKAGAAVAGAAVGAALMAAAGQAIEKGKLDAKLTAQLGGTPADMKKIGQISGSVYAAGFGEDMPAVNAAIKAAAQNGLVDVKTASAETAAEATKNLLTVGTVLEEDSERVSSAVSQMLRTGLAKSSQEAMDLLVAATSKGVNKSQDLLDTMNEYGTQFRKLGLEGPAAMGLLSQAIQAGARDSDTAADALKEFSIRAVDGSKTTAAGFQALGLDATKMGAQIALGGSHASDGLGTVLEKLRAIKDPVKQGQAAVALFGTKAEDLGAALYAMDTKTAAKEMGELKGATGRAAETMGSGAAKLDAFKRQVQMALVEKLAAAVPYIESTFGWLSRNSSWVTPLATALGIMGVAIGIVTAAQWAWNAALAISPVTWIVIGVMALVAVIVLVATKTRFFQTIWGAVWGFMKGVGAWFAGPFAGFFVAVWNKIVAFAKGTWNAIKLYFGFWWGMFQKVNGWMASAIQWAHNKWNGFIAFIKGIPGRIAGNLRGMWNAMKDGFRSAINWVIGRWNGLQFSIPSFSVFGHTFGGGTIGVPSIPYMDTGGTVLQTGLAVVHRDEQVTPAKITRKRNDGGGGGGATVMIKGDGSRASRLVLELIREAIRDQGGDPVKVLSAR